MVRLFNLLANFFPFWVLICSGLALFFPEWFTWLRGSMIVWGLAMIMIGMGITLSFDDFRRVTRTPRPVLIGVAAQFAAMPLLGWAIASGFSLEPQLAVGLILVACCPGGTASNVVSYIARADVALSVLMTMCSTFAAVVMTPLLTQWLAGAYVSVDGWSLFFNTLQVVILPVALGMLLNRYAPRLVQVVMPAAPLASVIVIALICASIIGANASMIRDSALTLLSAVALLHLGGFTLGYIMARLLKLEERVCRTISIEVGMQNSGLGAVLAQSSFAQMALAPVPSAISASFQSIIGSLLAAWWRVKFSENGYAEDSIKNRPNDNTLNIESNTDKKIDEIPAELSKWPVE
ncbi:bile acid:sodium symporter family protein [Methylobacter sp. YRD-M1]|uniref:bile acid:sodium symporter family protein n=1 Tax=Methylobacter sp. YRD-M1 TaxID=2911520 RepID=UPI00227D562D|nr:bile acid:sodium symporter family protein [Methylobacter sp. YRD-M1]WAK02492.1 bile acid:sodium symporter family protein [Methylobacter sp. YRD-M1]